MSGTPASYACASHMWHCSACVVRGLCGSGSSCMVCWCFCVYHGLCDRGKATKAWHRHVRQNQWHTEMHQQTNHAATKHPTITLKPVHLFDTPYSNKHSFAMRTQYAHAPPPPFPCPEACRAPWASHRPLLMELSPCNTRQNEYAQ